MRITPAMKQFCDSPQSLVPYFGEYTYIPKPQYIEQTIFYDNKFYMKSFNRYFVGISLTKVVRQIHASDFNLIKKQISEIRNMTKGQKGQKTFDFQ